MSRPVSSEPVSTATLSSPSALSSTMTVSAPAPVSIVSSAAISSTRPASLETTTRSAPSPVSSVVWPLIVLTRIVSAPPPPRTCVVPPCVESMTSVSAARPSAIFSTSRLAYVMPPSNVAGSGAATVPKSSVSPRAHAHPRQQAEVRRDHGPPVDADERVRGVGRDRAEDAAAAGEAAVVEDVQRVDLHRLVDDDEQLGQRRAELGRQADADVERAVLDLAALDEQRPGDARRRVALRREAQDRRARRRGGGVRGDVDDERRAPVVVAEDDRSRAGADAGHVAAVGRTATTGSCGRRRTSAIATVVPNAGRRVSWIVYVSVWPVATSV